MCFLAGVRIHFIIVMIRWTGLAPWELEFPFPGSLTSTFLTKQGMCFLAGANSIFAGDKLLTTVSSPLESRVLRDQNCTLLLIA